MAHDEQRASEPCRLARREDPRRVAIARQQPMAVRLELALSWNRVASELQAGLKAVKERERLAGS